MPPLITPSKKLEQSREDVVHWFPTYEVDDVVNAYGGSIERLGVMGELMECPTFPTGTKEGWYTGFDRWMEELVEERYITQEELHFICERQKRYEELLEKEPTGAEYQQLKSFFTSVPRYIVQDDWEGLHQYLAKEGSR